MVRAGEAIKRWIMCLTFQERKKKKLMRYKEEIRNFQEMETEVLNLEYINLKTEYEHRRNVLTVFVLTIVLSVLMDIWKDFYNFIGDMVRYNTAYHGDEFEIMKVVGVVFIILVAFISSIVLGILIAYTGRMKQIYRNLLIIDEIRNKR